ncbi:MAG: ABC transporter substrate-binding protein [Proteobacteria bacterium]|nr:ABC transporter substrate-binding protein [Pseudomonadota bacterium]
MAGTRPTRVRGSFVLPVRLPLLAALFALSLALPAGAQTLSPGTGPAHAIAMHGDIKYPAGFRHFDHVNPDAPKGGEIKQHALGTFDSFNPWIIRGVASGVVGLTVETLMVGSDDEPFTMYCLVCETVEAPADRSWVEFSLRPNARFHDGSAMEPEDVIWTFETLKAKGRPIYRSYYADVAKIEKTGPRKVRFVFANAENREMPLIVGSLPVLSRRWWEGKEFDRPLAEPPLGSGPYRIESFELGRNAVLRRVPDHWARDLGTNRGRYNFDVLRYEWYRDPTIALEAFLAGAYDLRLENTARFWAQNYDTPAFRDGQFRKVEFPERRVAGMQALVMNSRRKPFDDRRVRQALGYVFDFEWSNKNLFFDSYTRTRSYFDNSELAARGLPQGEEKALLERHKDRLPPELFTTEYQPPKTDGTGNIRDGIREATRLLRDAGWRIADQKLVDASGKQMGFEILLTQSQVQFERVLGPFVANLKRIGIDARIRNVDTAQYQNRSDDYDYDMVVGGWGQSESPGNEQREYWTSSRVAQKGGRNTAGIKDPVVDELVELLIAAPDRASLVQRTRALDRVLQWGHWVIPNWYLAVDRVVAWDRFGWPATTSKSGFDWSSWWIDPAKDAALRARRGR